MKPKLKFSRWIRWKNREKFHEKYWPGVYMLAITNKNLEDKKPNLKDVVYVGMTNSHGGLISRWNQFNNSIHGEPGHSGGKTVYKNLGNYKNWKKRLFVSALPVKCNVFKEKRTPQDLIMMGWITFLEYEALSKYKEIIGNEPKYNTH